MSSVKWRFMLLVKSDDDKTIKLIIKIVDNSHKF